MIKVHVFHTGSVKVDQAIYLSHMDFDHTSGLRLVRNAKAVFASKEELEDENCVAVLANHDSSVEEQVIEL